MEVIIIASLEIILVPRSVSCWSLALLKSSKRIHLTYLPLVLSNGPCTRCDDLKAGNYILSSRSRGGIIFQQDNVSPPVVRRVLSFFAESLLDCCPVQHILQISNSLKNLPMGCWKNLHATTLHLLRLVKWKYI
ncbi:hypothetical protein TNCV_162201 [Trichonephila clavipes]|nr:hypothetical protein TNCV_162201 [Trichonephila clavipes]